MNEFILKSNSVALLLPDSVLTPEQVVVMQPDHPSLELMKQSGAKEIPLSEISNKSLEMAVSFMPVTLLAVKGLAELGKEAVNDE